MSITSIMTEFIDESAAESEEFMSNALSMMALKDAELLSCAEPDNRTSDPGVSTRVQVISSVDVAKFEAQMLPSILRGGKAKGFDGLPAEITSKIFKYAMTASDGKIRMPCLMPTEFKPDVATGLLRANHQIYHEARMYLFSENIVVFNNFGSDLKVVARPLGLRSCRSAGCQSAMNGPTFNNVTFDIGDMEVDYKGEFKTMMFGNVLKQLQAPITIKHLRIDLRPFCFSADIEPETWAIGLENIRVTETLEMCGADYHWNDGDLRAIPSRIGMKKQPEESSFVPRDEQIFPQRMGAFYSRYYIAKTSDEVFGVEGQIVKDAEGQYRKWCTANGC